MPKRKNLEDSGILAEYLADLILKKKGTEIKILDLRNITAITDYFVVCSVSSGIQAKAVADFLITESKKKNINPWHNEGYSNLSWVLLDYVDVVVHIFLEETRRFYNLEGLWADAKITDFQD